MGITKHTAHHMQAADNVLAVSPSLNSLSSRVKSYPLLSTSDKYDFTLSPPQRMFLS